MKIQYTQCPVCGSNKKDSREWKEKPENSQLPDKDREEVKFDCGASFYWEFGEREGALCPQDPRVKK